MADDNEVHIEELKNSAEGRRASSTDQNVSISRIDDPIDNDHARQAVAQSTRGANIPSLSKRRHLDLNENDASITAEVKERIKLYSLDDSCKFTFDGKELWEINLDRMTDYFYDLSAAHKVKAFQLLADELTLLAVENVHFLGNDRVADQWEQYKAKVLEVFGVEFAISDSAPVVYTLADFLKHFQVVGDIAADHLVMETMDCGSIIRALINAHIVLPKTAFTAFLGIYNDEQLQFELCLASMDFGIDARWNYVGQKIFWDRMRNVVEEYVKLNVHQQDVDYLVQNAHKDLSLKEEVITMVRNLEQWRKGNNVDLNILFLNAESISSSVGGPKLFLSRYVPLSLRKLSFHHFDCDDGDGFLRVFRDLNLHAGNRAETARVVKKLRQLAPNDILIGKILSVFDDYFDNYDRNRDPDHSGARRVAHALTRLIEHSEGQTRVSETAIYSSLFHLIYYNLPNPVDGWYLSAMHSNGTTSNEHVETAWGLGLPPPLLVFVKVMESWVESEPREALAELHRQMRTPSFVQRHRHACHRCGNIHVPSQSCPDEKVGVNSSRLGGKALADIYKREANSRERVIPADVRQKALWNLDVRNQLATDQLDSI